MKAPLIFGALLLTLPALAQPKTIRVERLVAAEPMNQDFADVMTAKLISHLVEHGVDVLDGESDATTNAVLHVTFQTRGEGLTRIEGPVRLTDTNGRVLWAGEARSAPFSRSPSNSFAEVVAKEVEDFMARQK
jgi:hypothetical protein